MSFKHLLHKSIIEKTDNVAVQLFRYTFVGGTAFLVDFLLLALLTELGGVNYLVSASISFIAGLLVNYIISKLWVFRCSSIANRGVEFAVFAGIGLVGLVLNNLLLWGITELLGVYYLLSKVITAVIIYLYNFFARKYIIFHPVSTRTGVSPETVSIRMETVNADTAPDTGVKVLFVNTSVRTGGAAVAAGRLMRALQGIGVEVELCVRPSGYRARLCFLWERLCIWVANGFSRRNLFAVDIANAGVDITKSAEFREADIIHLHWINQGFLSMRSLRKIVQSGKPIIWTLHDMWACTAICHHARNCEAFHTQCGAWCSPHGQLPSGWKSKFADTAESGLSGGKTVCGDTPLTERVWRQKEELYRDANITFVSCSQWLDGKVALSALTKDKPHISIPNPIDTALFKPSPRHEGGEHSLRILFGACNIADKRKGIDYFVESLNILAANYPEMKEEIVIVLFGHGGEQFASLPPSSLSSKVSATSRLLPFKIEDRGYVESDEEMVRIYQSATLYITPSLEENLPNTVMEAMSCGVPCVSFAVGGLPEMIDHKENGYLAKYEDAEDLARGLAYILTHHDRDILCANAHNKVMTHYEQSLIANRYKTLYDQCLHSQ